MKKFSSIHSLLIFLLAIVRNNVNSYKFSVINKFFNKSSLSNSEISRDPGLESYLKGTDSRPWSGSRSILKRKGQVPNPELSPRDVIKIILAALQNNDDPQLDHGASVVL